ncbi:LRR receptor-like serine/threonine-protein kinase ERECTA [Iris pallida]|uniref:LRR receptor-like serine/threonine-protein kinase ERECTA n=1 Tax=Iris pallida TaxID=29817 RepID=A0AAX6G1X0_IRIPA|nr:LRR receptor-like serine/threonine-protein kinase ERECTA [Iris pallida]
MAWLASKFGFLAVLLALVTAGSGERSSPEAYVTLLYGDEFLLGVQILVGSIRDTGSEKDMVALVSDGISDFAKKLNQQCQGNLLLYFVENQHQVLLVKRHLASLEMKRISEHHFAYACNPPHDHGPSCGRRYYEDD